MASVAFVPSAPLALTARHQRRKHIAQHRRTVRTIPVALSEDSASPDTENAEARTRGPFTANGAIRSWEMVRKAPELIDEFWSSLDAKLRKGGASDEGSGEEDGTAGYSHKFFDALKSVSLVERLPRDLLEQARESLISAEEHDGGPPDGEEEDEEDEDEEKSIADKLSPEELQDVVNYEIGEMMGVGRVDIRRFIETLPDFDLYAAVNLAGFSFEMYKMPKGGMLLHGVDDVDYILTSTIAMRRAFSGMILLTMTRLETSPVPVPMAVRAVSNRHRVDKCEKGQAQSIYVEDKSEDVTLELYTPLDRTVLASTSFSPKQLSDGQLNTLTMNFQKIDLKQADADGNDEATEDEQKAVEDSWLSAAITVEVYYYDIRDVGDESLDAAVATYSPDDDNDVSPDELRRRSSGDETLRSFTELESNAAENSMETSELEELESGEWEEFATHVQQAPIGLHRMERLAYVINPDTDTRLSWWQSGQDVVVAFRGTEQTSWKDLLTDSMAFLFPFEPGAAEIDANLMNARDWMENNVDGTADISAAHYGFVRAYASVRALALEGVRTFTERGSAGYRLYVTGHSLGGALATLYAADVARIFPELKVTMYNFGSPKVGNRAFVREFDALVPDAYRVVNNSDLITRLPRRDWNFAHVGCLAVLREDGRLWVDDGIEEDRLIFSRRALDALVGKEVDTMHKIVMQSPSAVDDHLETGYFSSLVNIQLRKLRGETTTF